MRAVLLAAACAALALVPPAAAQAEPLSPTLSFGAFVGGGPIPGDGTPTDLYVPWTYEFATAAAPAGSTTIQWTLECGEGTVQFTAPASTQVVFEPGRTSYNGTAALPVRASAEAPGLKPLQCRLGGEAASTPTTPQASGTADFEAAVGYRGDVAVNVVASEKSGGPQKMVRYPIELENRGNARTLVRFEALQRPDGPRWHVLVPDPVVLDSPYAGGEGKASATVYVTVATPFHNGYVSENGRFVLAVVAMSADEPDQQQELPPVELGTSVQGWYVSGPSPALLLAGLALAALATRRFA